MSASEDVNKLGTVDLRSLLLRKQEQLDLDLQTGREAFDHPGEKGDASEIAWRDRLERFLPTRYQVSSGFVFDADGLRSGQVDVIIHDRHFCPLLFEQNDKLLIPAESVFGVFEVKQTLDRAHVLYAAEKISTVRSLRRTSAAIVDRGVLRDPREPFHILGGLLAYESAWSPPLGESLREVLRETKDETTRLDLGCAIKHGSFEVVYPKEGDIQLDTSELDAALLYWEMALFRRLQGIGSPMAIDMKEYLRDIEAERETPAELDVTPPSAS
jgi:hypothetical protein